MAMDEKYVADYPMINTGGCGGSKDRGKRKMVALQLCESDGVKLLSKRLQVLEEEASKMKEAMVVCMDERREIITEIWHLFRTIHSAHSSGSDTNKQSNSLPSYQERRYHNVGLLQALCDDANPGLVVVTRCPTVANAFTRRPKSHELVPYRV